MRTLDELPPVPLKRRLKLWAGIGGVVLFVPLTLSAVALAALYRPSPASSPPSVVVATVSPAVATVDIALPEPAPVVLDIPVQAAEIAPLPAPPSFEDLDFFRPAPDTVFRLDVPYAVVAEAEPEPPPVEVAVAEPEPEKLAEPVMRKANPSEIFFLLKRAKALLAGNDIAGARLVLERAAESNSPEALYLLAGTYDPARLSKDRYTKLLADPAKAKALYERAQALTDPTVTGSVAARCSCQDASHEADPR